MPRRLIRFLSSWRLTSALTLGFAACYVYFTFGEKPFEHWLNFVYRTPPGVLLYLALALNLGASAIRNAMVKLRRESVNPDVIRSMDDWLEIPLWSAEPLTDVAVEAGKEGFNMEVSGATAVSHKGRYSFLPGVVLRAGIVMVMVASLFSSNIRKSERAVFYEGASKELLGKAYAMEKIDPALPDDFLQVGEKSTFRLKGVSALVSASGREYRVTPGMPVKASGEYLRITHMGFAQPISGRTPTWSFAMDVFLDVLPPGKTDSETLFSSSHSLSFALAPLKTIEKGLVTGKLYNVRVPTYGLAIVNSATGEHSESVKAGPDGSTRVGDVDITLGQSSVYVTVQAVRDPSLPWLYMGVIVLFAGAAMMFSRFFWYEKKLYAFRTYESVLVGYSEEFYKKWGILKFQRLREALMSYTRRRE